MFSKQIAIRSGSVRWKTDNAYGFFAIHLIAVLAFFPWFFSWTGVILLIVGILVFGLLGINLCFHRLLTHRGLVCPLWLERSFAFLGACCLQDSPPHWVAAHRKHHHYADDERDPHSPLVGFFWAHMGWLLVRMEDMKRGTLIERYAKDIMRDPFYAWLERRHNWLKVVLVSWIAYFVAGFAFVAFSGGALSEATQFGLSLFVWGAVLRTVRRLAFDMVCQFGHPCLGISQLRYPRRQPQQRAHRVHCGRRRLAQQSSCRPTFGATWSHAVGDRHHVDDHPAFDAARSRQGGRPALAVCGEEKERLRSAGRTQRGARIQR